MKVSIIIPTYNEEDAIGDCIKTLLNQSYSNIEIIIVDDGSNDKTVEKVKSLREVKLLTQKHKGPGAARNLGSARASGDVLVFVDADMTFDNDFIKYLVKPIIEDKAKGTFSKEEYVSNWDNPWARCWNINESWEDKRRHPANYPDKQKVFRAILKSEFDKVGGFTPGGYTDDWSLSEKLGYRAVSVKGAKFYHKNPDDLKEIFYHAKWVSKRDYKLGNVGLVIAMLRALPPVSLFIGIKLAWSSKLFQCILFKLVYDAGILIGIIEMIITGDTSK